jgi:hypothetical protein
LKLTFFSCLRNEVCAPSKWSYWHLKVETKARILGLVSETSLNKLSQFLKNIVVTYCTARLFQDESFTIRLSSLTWCKWSPSTWYWKCGIWYSYRYWYSVFCFFLSFSKQHSYWYSNSTTGRGVTPLPGSKSLGCHIKLNHHILNQKLCKELKDMHCRCNKFYTNI